MATTAARQPKPTRKGVPEPARRAPAWTGARASPTFSPGTNSPRLPNGQPHAQGGFPPLGQTNGGPRAQDHAQDRNLQQLAGLTGTTITLITKTKQHYEGVVGSTNGEGDMTGVTLKDVKEISNPGAPLKDSFFIASTNIDSWTSGPADAKIPNGTDSFRTDTDISHKTGPRRERELQAWSDPVGGVPLEHGDDLSLSGPGSTVWDQFETNEKLFGVKTNFDMDQYTTKLNRSAADFKDREREAQRIANEIMGTATSNPHIAEERNMVTDDSGVNEEDKYGAVVRGANAYVPPGARRGGLTTPPSGTASALKADIPKVSVNGPDGASLPPVTQPTSPPKAASPVPSNKPPADPLPAFRDFVTNEKQRLAQKKQAIVKSEIDKRMAELVKFSHEFKLNKPIPDDLVPILAKDEEKQKQIKEKSTKDAQSASARNIGVVAQSSAVPATARMPAALQQSQSKPILETRKASPVVSSGSSKTNGTPAAATSKSAAAGGKPDAIKSVPKASISMVIQAIPPFKGKKSNSTPHTHSVSPVNGASQTAVSPAASVAPLSPSTVNRLNVNASSFKPNPKANPFSPASSSPLPTPSASASPKVKSVDTSATLNPFFGNRPIKKSNPVHIKDDFNPFKHNKAVEATQVAALWPYNGKRYSQMFPPLQHPQPQHSPHLAPPVPPPMPPAPYEDEAAAQAARGYVYAYPPYAYPGHPMMPGMGPPGPPGAYMPGPYMQPMGYPPGMPPLNGQPMYASPSMGQLPPPQGFMPPPPASYPPPPNGAGPRPSMPPTPIPAHAHPYYHQSPQLQHAVPYPMMMPPPGPNGPPGHPYDGSSPVPPMPMGGGVGHT